MEPLTQSYYSGASSKQIIYQTIGDYLDHICEHFPDNEALVVRHCHRGEFQNQRVPGNAAGPGTRAGELRTGIMAGAPCPVEVMKRVLTDMHMQDVLIAYGQTETSPVNHITLSDDSLENRTRTVGRAVPWVEIKITDENDRVVPVGDKGEICVRGYSVMRGYWNDEEKTRETIDTAGWLHSGD